MDGWVMVSFLPADDATKVSIFIYSMIFCHFDPTCSSSTILGGYFGLLLDKKMINGNIRVF
jgi:hypothetical protein